MLMATVVSQTSLTAGNLHGALLCVQRVELQVHGAGESEGHPDAEQDGPVRVYPDVEVGHQHVVHRSSPLVPEEGVGHPDLASVRQSQVFDFLFKVKCV